MVQEKHFGTMTIESDYERRFINYYKFRLRVYLSAFLCFVAVAFVVASLVIQVYNSSTIFPKSYEMAEGDMRVITVSTTFCEGISLERSKLARSLSTVSEVSLAKEKSVSNMTLDILIPYRKYWFKSFYFLKGSSIQIEASSDNFLKLLIFKGRSNLDGWIDKQSRQHITRTINSNDHNTKRTRISFVYQIPQEGNYYILFQHISGHSRVPKISVALLITRQLYDISSAVYSCNAAYGQICYTRLLFNSNERTILQVSRSGKYLFMKNIPTTWHCQPRIWFFLVVFGVGYVFCVILGLVVYILLMNRKREAFICKPRKPSVKTQNSFSGSSRNGGSIERKNSKEGSTRGQPGRLSSLGSQGNRPLSANGSLGRPKLKSSLSSVIPHIYKGANSDSDNEVNGGHEGVDQESASPRQSLLHRAPSLENISIASFDTTMSLPVTFSTFKNRLFDAETASCHSYDVDSSLRRHRNRHHPRFHQELKRDRDIISARSRARFEAREQEKLVSHQSDSQLSHENKSLTLPTRLSPDRGARRDFSRDLESMRQHQGDSRTRQSDSQLDYNHGAVISRRGDRAKRDFYRDLELARKLERDRPHQSDSELERDQKILTLPAPQSLAKRDFYRDLELARKLERDRPRQSDSELERDQKILTLPAQRSLAKRDFYRDLELARKLERDRPRQSDSELERDQKILTLPAQQSLAKRDFYRDLNLGRKPGNNSLIDHVTRLRPRERFKRDFYRDLELARCRDINQNHINSTKDDSDYERECDLVLERSDLLSPKHHKIENHSEQDDSDQCSIGDVLDRIGDEDRPTRAAALLRSNKTLSNGYPPNIIKAKPVQDQENHLVIIAQALPDGEVKHDGKKKKEKNSNKKDIKLRNHSNRRKENLWKPRLSIVSEV